MDDILSQIIAYAPDKIDTEIKARALVQGSRNMKLAQVPRSEMDNFNTPDLDQGADSILRPGETLEDFDVEFRRPNAEGGRMYQGQLISQLVTPNPDGSRPGYAPQPGWKKEKDKFLKWLKDNPDFDFANSSAPKIIEKSGTKFEVGTIQKLLNEKGIQTKHSIARTQETPKYTKKVLEELRKDLPPGVSVEPGRPGKYYFRIFLKGGKANKPTYRNSYVANEANKQIALDDFNKVSKEYYPGRLTNEEFKTLRLENKDMKTADFAKFLEGEGKTTYLGDKWSKDSVSYLQNKLDIGVGTTGPVTIRTVEESKKIIRKQPGAKFFFMGNPSDAEIKKYAANLSYQEKNLGKGGKKGFPVGMTKENKMFRNFYDSSRKKDGRIKIESKIPMDKDGDINWKMKDKDGVHEWKKVKFYDTKTGATYTWGKKYKPGDLRKQVDAAYGDGFFAKSVQTYDEQAKLNKTKFQGKALNEWMREGLLKKEFELKFNRKPTPSELKEWYALRKPNFSFTEAHHVEGVGENPFRMEVSYRAANRKQNNLLNSYKAGNLTKAQYTTAMENLSDTKGGIRYKTDGRFIGQTGTPESIITASGKDAGFSEKKIKTMLKKFEAHPGGCGKAAGGRILFAEGTPDGKITKCARRGIQAFMDDLKKGNYSKATLNILKGGGNILKNIVDPVEFFRLKNLIGLPAIGFMGLWEAGVVTDDVIRQGTPLNESLANNWLTKSFLPYTKDYAKAKNLLETGKVPSNMKKYVKDVVTFNDMLMDIKGIEGRKDSRLVDDSFGMIDGTSMYTKEQEQKDDEALMKKAKTLTENVFTPGTAKALEMKSLQDEKTATEMAKKEFSPVSFKKMFGIQDNAYGGLKDRNLTSVFDSYISATEDAPKDFRPITYQDAEYEDKKLPLGLEQLYMNKLNLKPRDSLKNYFFKDGPKKKIVYGERKQDFAEKPISILEDLTNDYNKFERQKEASKYRGYFGANEPDKFMEGGIASLNVNKKK